MAWLMILLGIILLSFGSYRVILINKSDIIQSNSSTQYSRSGQQFSLNQKQRGTIYSNQGSDIRNIKQKYDSTRGNMKLEKDLRENFHRLQDLNSAMNSVINELSWKEDSIKKSLSAIETEVAAAAEKNKQIISENGNKYSFENILNDTMNNNPAKDTSNNFQNRRKLLSNNQLEDEVLSNEQENKVPDKYLKIFELSEEGMTIDEIAEKMNLGVRETGLIFKLYGGEVDHVDK